MRSTVRCLIAILPLAAASAMLALAVASEGAAVTFASELVPQPVGTLVESLPMPGFDDVLAQIEVVEGPGYSILLEASYAIAPADPILFQLDSEPIFTAAVDRASGF